MADCLIAKHTLKVVIAQVCQNIGWHAVQSSPMDILVDVLQRYIFEIAKSVHQYSNQYNRTDPNLDDLGLTFKDFGIVIQEIEEYINNVESVPPLYKVADFPVKHPPNLQHPKPDSRELILRPEHIPSYLPLMHPDLEEDVFSQQSTVDGAKKNSLEAGASGDSPSPLSSPKHGLKRNDWPSETSNKKTRYYTEEEGRPMREVTSVFMTPAGFISPVHEGKTAEASLPCLVDSPPPTPELPSHSFASVSVKKDVKFKEIKKDKSSKTKKDKEASKKDVKKLKSSKKEKENKENAVGKHEKAVTSSSSKKEHSSHKSNKVDKSMKSDDPVRQKSKSDKMKLKAQKDEIRKAKESFKLSKMKAKLKHSGGSSSSSHMKSSKLSSSKKLKAAKVAKSIKHFKGDRTKIVEPQPPPPPPAAVPTLPKEIPFEPKPPPPPPEPKIERDISDDLMEDEDLDFREESPERLVIDDSLETQARQEKESRLEVIDECIDAVIRRGKEESEVENKAMDETINAVVRGPPVMMKKLEPKDIYDFTDTSDSSSLSSCDIAPHSPIHAPSKKDKKSNDSSRKVSESPKRSKKEKSKKKGNKEPKSKSPNPYASPKGQKSSNFILKVDDRTPSPILKDDLLSSDGSTPSSSPRSNIFDHSPQTPTHIHPPPLLSHVPPLPPPFAPGSSYTSSPFAPMRNLPCHTNPHFPTPPLFVTPSKAESGSTFQNMQPLNLAKSGPSSLKSSPEKFESNFSHSSQKQENSDLIKKAANIIDKSKAKDHKKDKGKKKGKKESDKVKEKKDKEETKEREEEKKKTKAKEKPKTKAEKIKVDKKKSKPEKKKIKEKEEKIKEDSTVPKMTLKFGSGSTKIFVKPNTKNSTSLSSSPSPPHDIEEDIMPTPSPPPHIATPSPPREPTPPPPRIPTPPPPSPSPPPVVKEIKEDSPPPVPPPPITKTTTSRGRGRGKKAATQAVIPPARTVITETLGTIVDESGNKIWICPACSRADDGSPMIGCDECDDWYHWVCVGIVVPPKEEENWFCVRCIAKRQGPNIKRRRKKHKKDK